MDGDGIIYFKTGEKEVGSFIQGNKIGEHITIKPNGEIISQVYVAKEVETEGK